MVKRRINRTPKRIAVNKEPEELENNLIKKITVATLKTNQRKRARRTTASVKSAASKRKDSENVSMASRSSNRSKGSKKRKVRKRDVKNERKLKNEPKASKSGKSTPVRLQKIDDFSNSHEEIKDSEIEKDERERLEKEILFSKSALSHNSEVSIPVEAFDGPLTRSKTKDYIHRRFIQDHGESVIPRLNLNQAMPDGRDDDASSPGRTESVFFSPIRDRLYTPMRNFARGITRSVGKFSLLSKNRQPHIDYEIANVAFWIGIVFVSLAIWMSSLLGKIPSNNYKFTCDYRDLHLKYNSTDTIVWIDGYVKVDRLWAPEGDLEYQAELLEIQQNFEDLINMHNPYTGGEGIFIKRDVTHQKAFDKIIGNEYFSEKLSSDLSVGETSITATPDAESAPKIAIRVAMISLNKNFKVEPPLLNYIWFSLQNYFGKSEFLKGYYLFGYMAILLLTVISCHQFLFKTTPISEAKKLVNLIKSDMKEKRLYRNGLSLQNIYNWYSSEINFTQPEFNAKVLPHIEQRLDESGAFRKTSNRVGEVVWKLE